MLIDEALHILNMERPRRPKNKIDCPHHADKTPSLHLYEDDWYCYSCGANGDAYGLIAAMTGRDIGDVLREYGDGNNQARSDFIDERTQVRELFNSYYEWQASFEQRLAAALSDLDPKDRSDKIADIHHEADLAKAELVSRNASPSEVESELRRITSWLSYCLEVEQGLRDMREGNDGYVVSVRDNNVSQAMDGQLSRPRLRHSVSEARRPGRSRLRGGGTPRQLGSVRVGSPERLHEGDDRRHKAHPRLLRSERASS